LGHLFDRLDDLRPLFHLWTRQQEYALMPHIVRQPWHDPPIPSLDAASARTWASDLRSQADQSARRRIEGRPKPLEIDAATLSDRRGSGRTRSDPPICSAAPFVISPDGCVQIRSVWCLFGRRTRPHMLN
jgi:hypothetical protein